MLADLLSKKSFTKNNVKPTVEALNAIRENQLVLNGIDLQLFDILNQTGVPAERLINSPIHDYFLHKNLLWDGKPIFFVREHGSGKYNMLRRTSVTELDNAYIVFADNYLVRHVWELHYFGYFEYLKDNQANVVEEFLNHIAKGELSVAARLVSEEISNLAFFKQRPTKTSSADIYFSHYFDVKGSYTINGVVISYKEFANRNKKWLDPGNHADWSHSHPLGLKVRKLPDVSIEDRDIEFLRAYNIRLLSPLFAFAFPRKRKFSCEYNGVLKHQVSGFPFGEDAGIRRLFFQHFFQNWLKINSRSRLVELMEQGGVSETELQQMLSIKDDIKLIGLPDDAGTYSYKAASKKSASKPKATKATKTAKVNDNFIVTTTAGHKFEVSSMPVIVATILEHYTETNQISSLQQLAASNPEIVSMIYKKLNNNEVLSIKSGKAVNKADKSGRLIYRVPYKVGAETGILTKNWYKEPGKNFEAFKNWAISKGYTWQ